MAPKRQNAASPAPSSATSPSKTSSLSGTTAVSSSPSANTRAASKQPQSSQEILLAVWDRYLSSTPQRVKLLDSFLGFLIIVGAIQFVYCCLISSFPFNAFLSGFSACVGQFVLTVSLRIQTDPANRSEFESGFSDERAFADFVFGSLILHFFCVNFIN